MRTTRMMMVGVLLVAGCGDDGGAADDDDTPAPDAEVEPEPDAEPPPEPCAGRDLATDLAWEGENRATLQAWIDAGGCRSTSYDAAAPPIALFDWDNTVIKNDIGDGITFYLIEHDKVLQPPGYDWGRTSRYLTLEAQAALTSACGVEVAPGQPLPTSTDIDCADEILSIYIDSHTTGGAAAFAGWNYRQMEPAYAWTAQLMAGYSPDEIKGFVAETVAAYTSAEIGATKTVGSRTVNAFIRVYEQIEDLIGTMQDNGFDVWIISASPQPVVEVFAQEVNVAADHVIGIRHMLDGNGKYTYHFRGCGTVADAEDTMISYVDGKRCWTNKVIHGVDGAAAMTPPSSEYYFAAGDSDTDITFLRDSRYHLAIDRNKAELMCHAWHGFLDVGAGDWIVNEMFILPRAPRTTPYPCSTSACKDAAGVSGPCLDDAGNVLADISEPQ